MICPVFPTIVLSVFSVLALTRDACAAAKSKPPEVTVQDVDGKNHTGTLTAVDEKQLSLAGKKPVSIAMRDVFRIDFTSASSSKEVAGRACVLLSTGERVAVAPTKIDGDDLYGVWTGLPGKPAVRIPLMSVRALVLQPPDTHRAQRLLSGAVQTHTDFRDELILRNGDRVSGRLETLTATGAKISGTAATIRRSEIRAVLFNPRYIQKPKPADTAVRLQISDGSQLAARRVSYHLPDMLEVVPYFGGRVKIPLTSLATIQFFGHRVMPLAERKPAVYEFTPYLAGNRPLKQNRNVLGGPLKLRGRRYGSGLGMHSRSRVTYELTGDDKQFLATVGIDDAAKGKGHAIFLVELDGKPIVTSPVLTGKSPPYHIGPIPLTGHKRLTLIVDYGPFGDVLDYADWCDAVLIAK